MCGDSGSGRMQKLLRLREEVNHPQPPPSQGGGVIHGAWYLAFVGRLRMHRSAGGETPIRLAAAAHYALPRMYFYFIPPSVLRTRYQRKVYAFLSQAKGKDL